MIISAGGQLKTPCCDMVCPDMTVTEFVEDELPADRAGAERAVDIVNRLRANAGVYCSICHKKVYKEDYAWCNRKIK